MKNQKPNQNRTITCALLTVLLSLLTSTLHAGPRGTTLTGDKTASVTITENSRYPWTIEKSTLPGQLPVAIPKGQSVTIPFAINVTRGTLVVDRSTGAVTGQICLTNPGSAQTQGLFLTDQLEENIDGSWVPVGTRITVSVPGELAPGVTRCHAYTLNGLDLNPAGQYRNHAIASIDNWAGFEGTEHQLHVTQPLQMTVITRTFDESALVSDFFTCPAGFNCSPSSITPLVTGTTTIPYSVTLTNDNLCCGKKFSGENTATVDPVDTHLLDSASASVSITTGSCPANLCYNTGPVGIEEFSYLTVFGLPTTSVNLSKVTITGNVGVSEGGQILDGLPVRVSGAAYLHTGVNYPNHPTNYLGGIFTDQDLSQEWAAAQNAASTAAGLTPTAIYSTWNSSLTITGNGGVNVLQVGSVALGSTSTIILNGTNADLFIVNVSGDFDMGGDSKIQAGPGIQPYQILINITGSTGIVNADRRTSIDGIIIAAQRSATFHGLIRGNIIVGGATLDMISGVNVFQVCTMDPPCDPITSALCIEEQLFQERAR
jgi:hypothetical protein